MKELSSIWDGWEKQCFGRAVDYTGASCAVGYINDFDRWIETRARVGMAIKRQFSLNGIVGTSLMRYDFDNPGHAIIYANNVLKLTPEQFREIDRLTQYEQIQRELAARIDSMLPDLPPVELSYEIQEVR